MIDALSKSENLQMDCEQCRPAVKFYCDPFLNAFSSKEKRNKYFDTSTEAH